MSTFDPEHELVDPSLQALHHLERLIANPSNGVAFELKQRRVHRA